MNETRGRPADMIRQSITGSTSGSASPSTRYGSFPPGTNRTSPSASDLERRLLEATLRPSTSGKSRTKRSKSWGWDKPARELRHPRSATSTSLLGAAGGAGSGITIGEEDHYETSSEEDADRPTGSGAGRARRRSPDGSDDDAVWSAGDDLQGSRGRRGAPRLRERSSALVASVEDSKQWGVQKMELMGRQWGRRGLITIYAGVYLISTLTSLEIAYAVGKPPITKVLDVFGRAEGITIAAAFYSIGFLLTSVATDARVYIIARAISALGGQGIQLAQQIIIADTTTLTNRGLITSTISLPWLVTTWIGPALGSFFQSHGETGYRSGYLVFGLLLPLVASVLIGTLCVEWHRAKRLLTRRPSISSVHSGVNRNSLFAKNPGHHTSVGSKVKALWKDLDVVGLAALTLGCALVLLPLTLAAQTPASWADIRTWVLILTGVVTLAFFVSYEFTWSPVPLLPPRLLKNRTIMGGSALGFFHFASQFCYESFFTSFLQVARGYSPRDASWISQSYIFSASIFAIAAGAAAKYTQRYKWVGIAGVIIHAFGTWLMMKSRNLNSTTFELVISQIIGGAGGGWTTIAAQIGCQSVVGHQDVGIATAIFLTITQIGGAVGGAIAGAVWSTMLPSRLKANLPADKQNLVPEILESLSYTLTFPRGDPVRDAIDAAYVSVQRVLNILAILMALPALIAVLAMNNTHLEKDDQGQGDGVVVLGRATVVDEVTDSETSSLLGEA